MPEYNRKGRASAGAGSGATLIRPPTDKELGFTCLKSRWVLQDTSPPFFTKGRTKERGMQDPKLTKYCQLVGRGLEDRRM